jgi:paired amphipathic helix protein Sin3a
MPNEQTSRDEATASSPKVERTLKATQRYLDQIRVQFAHKPDVVNKFLDIMKDFSSGAINIPGVTRCIGQLFRGNRYLIQGFQIFLPSGLSH